MAARKPAARKPAARKDEADTADTNEVVETDERLPGVYLDDLERERRQQFEDDYHERAKKNSDDE